VESLNSINTILNDSVPFGTGAYELYVIARLIIWNRSESES